MLELRPVLRNQVKEYEQTLLERDTELRQLKYELNMLRCEKEAVVQNEKDALLDPTVGVRQALLRRYAASFSLQEGKQLQNVFFMWRHYAHQRTMRSKMLKKTCLSLTTSASQQVALVFSNWQSLVREKKQAQIAASKKRQQFVAQSYAAKMLSQTDSTTLRAIVIAWWRYSKEAALHTRFEAVQAERRAAQKALAEASDRKASVPLAHSAGKPCCTLM